MHRDNIRATRIGWALIFLLSALPLLDRPVWAQTAPAAVRIETIENVPPGETAELTVRFEDRGSSLDFAGFDLLVNYDPSRAQLISVAPGDFLIDCEWEYFAYRTSIDSAAPPGGLNGRLRIVALAETNNGEVHPSCLLDSLGVLAVLTFGTVADSSLAGQYLPVRFYWIDCGDNVFASATGDSLAISRDIIDQGTVITADAPLPGYTGAPTACLTDPTRGVVRGVDFYNGGIRLAANPAETFKAAMSIIAPPYLRPGDTATISLALDSVASGFETGGFNLFLQYDSSAITILSVEQGQALTDCAWETFAWRHGNTNDCNGSPCEKPTIHITALADYITPGEPLCWAISVGEIARLTIVASSDSTSAVSAYPIEWAWYACTDNEWASKNGDSVYLSRRVLDHNDIDITAETAFPTVKGSPSFCLPSATITRSIDYRHGLVDIVSVDSLDNRGDINGNGVPYEIADAVLLRSSFLFGPAVFTVDPPTQIAASDVNADNIPMTLDDFIYILRIVQGSAQPYPRQAVTSDTLVLEQDVVERTVSFSWPGLVRGLFLKFDDSVTVALSRDFAAATVGVLDDSTRVVITPSFDSLQSFAAGEVLTYTGDASLVSAEASYDGVAAIPLTIRIIAGPAHAEIIPHSFSVSQAGSTDPVDAVLYIGDMTGCAPSDIDPATVRINGTIPGLSWATVPPPPGFAGDVLAVNFDARGLIDPLFPSWGTDTAGYGVSWLAGQACPQGASGTITLTGYQLGDVNADGILNISDLTLLVSYFFGNGASQVSAEAADVNGSGSISISDLVALADILFH